MLNGWKKRERERKMCIVNFTNISFWDISVLIKGIKTKLWMNFPMFVWFVSVRLTASQSLCPTRLFNGINCFAASFVTFNINSTGSVWNHKQKISQILPFRRCEWEPLVLFADFKRAKYLATLIFGSKKLCLVIFAHSSRRETIKNQRAKSGFEFANNQMANVSRIAIERVTIVM